MGLKVRSLSLNLPFGLGGVNIDVTEAESRAAWQLYVEFATRVTGHSLEPGAGSAREALDSLYYLFGATREVLRAAGPEVGKTPQALGPLAIDGLNTGLRPFLVRWHTALRQAGDELDGEQRAAFDRELADLREGLDSYVDTLALIAGVKKG